MYQGSPYNELARVVASLFEHNKAKGFLMAMPGERGCAKEFISQMEMRGLDHARLEFADDEYYRQPALEDHKASEFRYPGLGSLSLGVIYFWRSY